MRNLVFILSVLLLCSNLGAEERTVELKKKVETLPNRSENSINLIVVNDGNNLIFSSIDSFDFFYFDIKTITGETVMADTISLVANQSYTISIENLECDIYVLEIKIGDELYYGYLEIY